ERAQRSAAPTHAGGGWLRGARQRGSRRRGRPAIGSQGAGSTKMIVWLWIAFHLVVVAALALDLGVFHRRPHAVQVREAAVWSAIWVSLGLAFGAVIYLMRGPELGTQYVMAYVIEKALSVDNLFVFVLVFTYFRVAPEHQHRILFWGVLGAIVMRGVLILGGVALVERFDFILYFFGALLVWSGLKMLRAD